MANGAPSWWEFSFATAAHITARTPTRRLSYKTPIELFNKNTQPDVSYFRTWGSAAYVHIPKERRKNKMSQKSELMLFMGYAEGTKGWRFMNKNNKLFMSPNAIFVESWFPHVKYNKIENHNIPTSAIPAERTCDNQVDSSSDTSPQPSLRLCFCQYLPLRSTRVCSGTLQHSPTRRFFVTFAAGCLLNSQVGRFQKIREDSIFSSVLNKMYQLPYSLVDRIYSNIPHKWASCTFECWL